MYINENILKNEIKKIKEEGLYKSERQISSDQQSIINVKGQKVINFCGNNGDPIYHTNFIELCNKLKNNNNTIHIVTNGSAKTQNWWESLTTTLNEYDTITFSIDGLEDTNHIYRKNAKWNSIMNAVKIVSSSKVGSTP